MIYLDNNATTPPLPEVIAIVRQALERTWGNPSSIHRIGSEAKRLVELAREQVASLVGSSPANVVFTSGGTEGANMALAGFLAQQPGRRVVVTSRMEHSAVREFSQRLALRGTEVLWLPNDRRGVVEADALAEILSRRAAEIAVVSVMAANNETGVIQPWERIGALCREAGVRYHCDATQWAGRMPLSMGDAPVDAVSFAAHKFHGPKGAGAVVLRAGQRLEPFVTGGSQERSRRGGTENVPAIAGMGVACEMAAAWLADPRGREEGLARRELFEALLRASAPEAVVNGGDAPRLWNTSNVGFPRLESEALLLLLSEHGVAGSAGSACASGSLEPSPILRAMNIPPDVAHGSVRFSQSRFTTEDELRRAAEVIDQCVQRLRKSSAALGVG